MTRFTASTSSTAQVPFAREQVWAALTDPDLLPRLTPNLKRIDADGDRWTWHLGQIPVLGRTIGISFTEVMTFEEPRRIEYAHDDSLTEEKTSVEGVYVLEEAGEGTEVSIDLTVNADLPFPTVSKLAVQTAMKGVMAGMGRAFARNLLKHLRSTS